MTTTSQTPPVPFGARADHAPHVVKLPAGSFDYDPDQQINLTPAGTPWSDTAVMATCTDTNLDSRPDDVSDPYMIG